MLVLLVRSIIYIVDFHGYKGSLYTLLRLDVKVEMLET